MRFNNANLNHEKLLHHIYNLIISTDLYAFLLKTYHYRTDNSIETYCENILEQIHYYVLQCPC
jgi:hypothetical protein